MWMIPLNESELKIPIQYVYFGIPKDIITVC